MGKQRFLNFKNPRCSFLHRALCFLLSFTLPSCGLVHPTHKDNTDPNTQALNLDDMPQTPPSLETAQPIATIQGDPVLSTLYSTLMDHLQVLSAKYTTLNADLQSAKKNRQAQLNSAISTLNNSFTNRVTSMQTHLTNMSQQIDTLAQDIGPDMVNAIESINQQFVTNSSQLSEQNKNATLSYNMNNLASNLDPVSNTSLQAWKDAIFQEIQGNYTKTLSVLSTQQKSELSIATLQAQKNIQTKVNSITTFVNDHLVPVIEDLVTALPSLTNSMSEVASQEEETILQEENNNSNLHSATENAATNFSSNVNQAYTSNLAKLNANLRPLKTSLASANEYIQGFVQNDISLSNAVGSIQVSLENHLAQVDSLTEIMTDFQASPELQAEIAQLTSDVYSFPTSLKSAVSVAVANNPSVAQLTQDLSDSQGRIQSLSTVIQQMINSNFHTFFDPYILNIQSQWTAEAEQYFVNNLQNALSGSTNYLSSIALALQTSFMSPQTYTQISQKLTSNQQTMNQLLAPVTQKANALLSQNSSMQNSLTTLNDSAVQLQTTLTTLLQNVQTTVQTANKNTLLQTAQAQTTAYATQIAANFKSMQTAIAAAQITLSGLTSSGVVPNSGPLGDWLYAAIQYQTVSQTYQNMIQLLFENLCTSENLTCNTPQALASYTTADFASAYQNFKQVLATDAQNLAQIQAMLNTSYNLLSGFQNEMAQQVLLTKNLASRSSVLEAQASSFQNQLNDQAQGLAALKAAVTSNALSLGSIFTTISASSNNAITTNFAQDFAQKNSDYIDAYTLVAGDSQVLSNSLNQSIIEQTFPSGDWSEISQQAVTNIGMSYTAFLDAYSKLNISLWQKLNANPIIQEFYNDFRTAFYKSSSYDYARKCPIQTQSTVTNAMGVDVSLILLKQYLYMLLVDATRPPQFANHLFFDLNNMVYKQGACAVSDLQCNLVSLVNVEKVSSQDPQCQQDIEAWMRDRFNLVSDPDSHKAHLASLFQDDTLQTYSHLASVLAGSIASNTNQFTQFQNLLTLAPPTQSAYKTEIATAAIHINNLALDSSTLNQKEADLNTSLQALQGVFENFLGGYIAPDLKNFLTISQTYADSEFAIEESYVNSVMPTVQTVTNSVNQAFASIPTSSLTMTLTQSLNTVDANYYADTAMQSSLATFQNNLLSLTNSVVLKDSVKMTTVFNSAIQVVASAANSALTQDTNYHSSLLNSVANSGIQYANSLLNLASNSTLASTITSATNAEASMFKSLTASAENPDATLFSSGATLAGNLTSNTLSQAESYASTMIGNAVSLATADSSQINTALSSIATSAKSNVNSLAVALATDTSASISQLSTTLITSYLGVIQSTLVNNNPVNFQNYLLAANTNNSDQEKTFTQAVNNAITQYGTSLHSLSQLTSQVTSNQNNLQSLGSGVNNALQLIQILANRLGYADISGQATLVQNALNNGLNSSIVTSSLVTDASTNPAMISKVEHYYTNVYQTLLTSNLQTPLATACQGGTTSCDAISIADISGQANTQIGTTSTAGTASGQTIANVCNSSSISLLGGISGNINNNGWSCWINYDAVGLASGQNDSLESVVFRVIGSADMISMRVANYAETFGFLPSVNTVSTTTTTWPTTSTNYITYFGATYGTTYTANTNLPESAANQKVHFPLITQHADSSAYNPSVLANLDTKSDWANFCRPYAVTYPQTPVDPSYQYGVNTYGLPGFINSSTYISPVTRNSVNFLAAPPSTPYMFNPGASGGLNTDPTSESFWAYISNPNPLNIQGLGPGTSNLQGKTSLNNAQGTNSIALSQNYQLYQLEKVFNVTGRIDYSTPNFIQNYILNNPNLTEGEFQTMLNFMNGDRSVAQITGSTAAGVYDLYAPSMLANLANPKVGSTCKYFVFTPIRKVANISVSSPSTSTPMFTYNYKLGVPVAYKVQLYSPLVLDIINKGPLHTKGKSPRFTFDIYGNGTQESTGWVSGYEGGFLVLDAQGDGKITSGKQLFGQGTLLPDGTPAENGFEALAQYDTENRGAIDASNPIFSKLKVWFDRNLDGVSQAEEVVSLQDLGITSISLGYEDVPQGQRTNQGNLLKYRAKYHGRTCPASGCNVYDVYFSTTSSIQK